MKAQPRFGLDLSWLPTSTVFLIDIGILVMAGDLPAGWQPAAWWSGVGVAAVVALFGLVSYRRITVPSAVVGWLRDWWADPQTTLTAPCTPGVNHHRRYGREPVGVREYDGRLVSVIAVDEPDGTPRQQRRKTPAAALLVLDVAAGLRQFDVQLEGIDIVSVGLPASRGGSRSGDKESTGLAPRGTWLVLRMDPQSNFTAVAARDSVASTLAAATERLAHDLAGRRCSAWPMSGDELAELDRAVLAGLEPSSRNPGWRHLKHANGVATSFWVSPRDINSETLGELWRTDADATVVTVRLTAHQHGVQVCTLVRFHSTEPLPKMAGLNRLTGRQLRAVRASLPTSTPRPPLIVPGRELADNDELAVPIGPVRRATGKAPAVPATDAVTDAAADAAAAAAAINA